MVRIRCPSPVSFWKGHKNLKKFTCWEVFFSNFVAFSQYLKFSISPRLSSFFMNLTLALSTSTMIDTYQTRKVYWAFAFLPQHNSKFWLCKFLGALVGSWEVGNRKANKIVARLVPPSVFLEVAVAGILATAASWPQTAFYKSRNSILPCSR